MKNKIIILLVLSFLTIQHLYSQNVPGYQGKKLWVEYNPSIALLTNNIDLYHMQAISIHYVLSRNASLGLLFEYNNANFAGIYDVFFRESYKFKEDNIALGLRLNLYANSNRGSLAPVGIYNIIDLKYGLANIKLEGLDEQIDTKGSYVEFGWGMGERFILKDRIVLNFFFVIGGNILFDNDIEEGFSELYTSGGVGIGFLLK